MVVIIINITIIIIITIINHNELINSPRAALSERLAEHSVEATLVELAPSKQYH